MLSKKNSNIQEKKIVITNDCLLHIKDGKNIKIKLAFQFLS